MAIMEGMAQGVIPISTPVGDIPKHIRSAATGYLTTSIDPAIVVKEMVDYISVLLDQNERRLQLNKEVYEYAKMHFSIEKFSEAYRGLLVAR